MPQTNEYKCCHPSSRFLADCRLCRFQEFCLKLRRHMKANGRPGDPGVNMERRKLSIPRRFGKKNYAGWRPSVEDEVLTAINTEPEVPHWLSRNWKAIVFAVYELSRRCLEFHHPN